MCWGWEFIIFDESDIFEGPQGPAGTILVPVEIEVVPLIGLLPSPPPGGVSFMSGFQKKKKTPAVNGFLSMKKTSDSV